MLSDTPSLPALSSVAWMWNLCPKSLDTRIRQSRSNDMYILSWNTRESIWIAWENSSDLLASIVIIGVWLINQLYHKYPINSIESGSLNKFLQWFFLFMGYRWYFSSILFAYYNNRWNFIRGKIHLFTFVLCSVF